MTGRHRHVELMRNPMLRPTKPKAVLFDFLTALIDSGIPRNSVAGNVGDGCR